MTNVTAESVRDIWDRS